MQGTTLRASPAISSAFRGLPAHALAQIQQECLGREFLRGDRIYRRGDPQRQLYIVREGSVKLCFPGADGQDTIVGIAGRGEAFGGTGSMLAHNHYARAAERTSVFVLHLDHLFARSQALHDQVVLAVANHRLEMTTRILHDTLSGDVRARVGCRLAELARRHGSRTPHGTRLQMRLTQEDLARMTGTSRESVNKVVAWFSRNELLANAGGRYVIMDAEALEAAARGYALP